MYPHSFYPLTLICPRHNGALRAQSDYIQATPTREQKAAPGQSRACPRAATDWSLQPGQYFLANLTQLPSSSPSSWSCISTTAPAPKHADINSMICSYTRTYVHQQTARHVSTSICVCECTRYTRRCSSRAPSPFPKQRQCCLQLRHLPLCASFPQ